MTDDEILAALDASGCPLCGGEGHTERYRCSECDGQGATRVALLHATQAVGHLLLELVALARETRRG